MAGRWRSSAVDFGSLLHLGLGLATIVLIVAVQRFGRGMVANLSVLLGLVAGTALAAMLGQASFRQVPATPWFAFAHPLLFGPPRFVLLPAVVMSLSMLVVMTETHRQLPGDRRNHRPADRPRNLGGSIPRG